MKKLVTKLVLLSLFMAPAAVFAQKIGVVNVNKLLGDYAEMKGLNKMLDKHFEKPKEEVDKLVEEIKKIEKEIKTNELLMTEVKLTMLKKKLNKTMQTYRIKVSAMEKDFKEMRGKEVGKFKQILVKIIKSHADENKYDLILNEGVVYVKDEWNVTDEIAKRLKKEVK